MLSPKCATACPGLEYFTGKLGLIPREVCAVEGNDVDYHHRLPVLAVPGLI